MNEGVPASEKYSAITPDDVTKVAARLSALPDDNDRVTVVVDGRGYDPVELFAVVAGVGPDQVQLSTVLNELKRRNFVIRGPSLGPDSDGAGYEGKASQLSGHRGDRDARAPDGDDTVPTRAGQPSEADEAEHAGAFATVLTPYLAQQMQRYRGKWVAVADGKLLQSADTLEDLLQGLAGTAASVMLVPSQEGRGA